MCCVLRRFAAISPGDTYSARLGGIYGSDSMEPPFVMGHEGVFVVAMVGLSGRIQRKGTTAITRAVGLPPSHYP